MIHVQWFSKEKWEIKRAEIREKLEFIKAYPQSSIASSGTSDAEANSFLRPELT